MLTVITTFLKKNYHGCLNSRDKLLIRVAHVVYVKHMSSGQGRTNVGRFHNLCALQLVKKWNAFDAAISRGKKKNYRRVVHFTAEGHNTAKNRPIRVCMLIVNQCISKGRTSLCLDWASSLFKTTLDWGRGAKDCLSFNVHNLILHVDTYSQVHVAMSCLWIWAKSLFITCETMTHQLICDFISVSICDKMKPTADVTSCFYFWENKFTEMLADINAEAVGWEHTNSDYVLFTTDCFQALFSTINLCVKLSGLLVLLGSYFLLPKPRKIWERQIKPLAGYR